MTFRERRTWSADRVRSMCIRNDYYTKGCNDEYCDMLATVDSVSPTTDNIYMIALDISKHSEMERYGYKWNDAEAIEGIMFNLVNDCTYTHIEIEPF